MTAMVRSICSYCQGRASAESKSWTRFFAQGAKWNFCLTAGKIRPRIRRDHEEEGAADKAECLTGCKSLYRQLPVFGRLAYPGRAAATKHERLGRKSPSCPAAVLAAVGTIRGASKLGGRNIMKYLQPRNMACEKSSFAG